MKKTTFLDLLNALSKAERLVTVTRSSRARDRSFLSYFSCQGRLAPLEGTLGEFTLLLGSGQYCTFGVRAVSSLGSAAGGAYIVTLK